MITEQDFIKAPESVIAGLKMAAICHTTHTGIAASALMRAAFDILSNDLGPEQMCEIVQQATTEALKLHYEQSVPAGHA